MDDTQEILSLLRENNSLLKELVSALREFKDPENIAKDDIKDLCMNIIANIIASDFLENEKDIVKLIRTKFKMV